MKAAWAYVERSLCLCWAKSGPCCAILGPSWAYVGPSWAHVEPSGPAWAYIGPGWAYVGPCSPMLDLCWPMLSHLGRELCWGHVWAGRLCWNDLKMPIFPPRAPPGAQNVTSPRWKPLLPKGPKHRKKTMFLNIARTKHRKLQGLQLTQSLTGVKWGSAGGGAEPITFGYHWRPPARTRAGPWPAPGLRGYAPCPSPWSTREEAAWLEMPRVPVPDVAFWSDKKLAPNSSLQASKQLSTLQNIG